MAEDWENAPIVDDWRSAPVVGDQAESSPLRGFRAGERPQFGPSGFLDALKDTGIGLGETALTLGSGLAGTVAGGFGGLMSLGEGADAAAENVRSIQENLTYQPRTQVGQSITETIGLPFMLADKGITEGAGMLPGGPLVQTAAKTTAEALPALFGRGRIGPKPLSRQQTVAQEAQAVGYKIPTSDVNPASISRSTVEGVAGKPRMQQESAFRNQQVTNDLAGQSLGLPKGAEITRDALKEIRKQAGAAYDVLDNAGTITATVAYRRALADWIKDLKSAAKDFEVLGKAESPVASAIDMARGLNKPTFQASSAKTAIKTLRDEASSAFRDGRGEIGAAYRNLSKAVEDAVDLHLTRHGDPAAVQAFKDARVQMAKSFSIEKALDGDGFVSAPKLAAQLKRGEPLSGELALIAKFAENFPKSARVIKEKPIQIGRISAMVGGGGGGLALGAEPVIGGMLAASALGGPAVRAGLLSRAGQATLGKPRGALGGVDEAMLGLLGSDLLSRSPETR